MARVADAPLPHEWLLDSLDPLPLHPSISVQGV